MPDIAIPVPELFRVTGTPVAVERLLKNVRASSALRLPSLRALCRPVGEPVAIVGGGPSLKHTLPELRRFPGKVVAAGSSHDFLRRHGIRPWGAVATDPQPEMARYYRQAHGKTQFFLASICDPALFKALQNHRVTLFHADINVPYPVHTDLLIGGGCTVVLRALHVLHALGFRDFHAFGFDGCDDPETGAHHAYDTPPDGEVLTYRFAGREFRVRGALIGQFQDFRDLLQHHSHDFTLSIHGDGLMAELLRQFNGAPQQEFVA